MKTYPFTSFEYYESTNLSDNIQSLVTERLFPNIVKRFDRDTLAYAPPMAPSTIVMNEWFSYHPETCLPCFSHLCPIFESYFPRKDVINYLKYHELIGCSEPYKTGHLLELSVKIFVLYCLALSLLCREKVLGNRNIFVLDAFQIPLPEELQMDVVYYNISFLKYRGTLKHFHAKQLLQTYRSEAGLTVMTRLHCLLPCIAMDRPVISFNNPNDYRASWVKNLGLKELRE